AGIFDWRRIERPGVMTGANSCKKSASAFRAFGGKAPWQVFPFGTTLGTPLGSSTASEKKMREGRPLTRKVEASGKKPCISSPILEYILTEYSIVVDTKVVDITYSVSSGHEFPVSDIRPPQWIRQNDSHPGAAESLSEQGLYGTALQMRTRLYRP